MQLRELRGQGRVVEAIQSAWMRGRLHHGLLFAGPPGVGKETCAIAVARLLLCQTPLEGGEGCQRCPACQRVDGATHPDLLQLSRERTSGDKLAAEIKIQQLRALQKQLSYQPFEGGRRVVLIKEAERLNLAAANALLKTLEEPPEGTSFILLSDAPERLLPTIRSRCQLLRFAPLAAPVLTELLATQRGLPEAEAALIARLAEGSLGRAAVLLDEGLLGERVELLTGLEAEGGLRAVEGQLRLAERLAKTSEETLRLRIQLIRSWLRDLLCCFHGLPREQLIHQDLEETLRAQAARTDGELLARRLRAVDDAERQLFDRYSDRRLILENLLLYLGEGGRRRRGPLKL